MRHTRRGDHSSNPPRVEWAVAHLGNGVCGRYHCHSLDNWKMTRYYARHLRRLANEADTRFRELMRALDTHGAEGDSIIQPDGIQVRLAVDDFKTILTEIRRLK